MMPGWNYWIGQAQIFLPWQNELMRLLLTRPRQESEALAKTLSRLGHETLIEPLLSIEPVGNAKIRIGNFQALIVTSVNGARALSTHVQADHFRQMPIYAVGQATAEVLDRFNVIHAGTEGVAVLRDRIRHDLAPEDGPLLYVRGVHVASNLALELAVSGYTVEQVIIYEAVEKKSFSPVLIEEIKNNRIEGVVLFSPRTATVFSKLMRKAGLTEQLGAMTFYCLSQKVSDSIQIDQKQLGYQMVIAATPSLQSLLNSIKRE
jgi:uroporphyrinogen-III synthase